MDDMVGEFSPLSTYATEEQVESALEQGGTLIYDRQTHVWTVQVNTFSRDQVVDPRLATKFIKEKRVRRTWEGNAVNIYRKIFK